MRVDWQQRYLNALARAGDGLQSLSGLIVAFNTNIDGVKTVDGRWLSDLLGEDHQLRREVEGRLGEPPREIEKLSDLITALLYHMKRGIGGERLVFSREVFRWLSRAFGPGQLRMGGQAGIMSNALSSLHVSFIVPHVAQLPTRQAELFEDQERVRIPVAKPEGVAFARPLDAVRHGDRELVHWVLNFDDRTQVSIGDVTVKAPRENRFIATYDEDNTELRIAASFTEGVRARIDQFDGGIISGFHLLRRNYRDGSNFESKLGKAFKQLSEWRELRPDMKLHLELGSMQSREVEAAVLHGSRLFHSLGLNEDELESALSTLGLRRLDEGANRVHTAGSIWNEASTLKRHLRGDRLNVHTRDFSISLLSGGYAGRPETEQEALLLGAALAGGRALTGGFLRPEQLLGLLAAGGIGLNANGVQEHQALISSLGEQSPTAAREMGERGIAEMNGLVLVYAPSLWVERTASTVGLGDALSSASFAGNLR